MIYISCAQNYRSMETKTIALDREAYEILKAQKKRGESFSAVVKRVFKSRRSVADFAGIWKDAPKEDIETVRRAIARGRELDLERMEKLLKRMG